MKNALTAWGFHVMAAEKFRMGAYLEDALILRQFDIKISKIVDSIIGAVQGGAAQNPTLFSLVSFAIQKRYFRTCARAGAVDRSYWEKKGRLGPQTHYYMPVRGHAFKLAAAKVFGTLMARIFI